MRKNNRQWLDLALLFLQCFREGLGPCFRRDERGKVFRWHFYVYILASKRNGTLYTGSTDALEQRVWVHKTKAFGGFTAKYNVNRLVWYEVHDSRESAFVRERQIKKWKRAWKLELIEGMNPDWNDLNETFNH